MQTITLYHDPVQGLLHILTCQVWSDGTHQVIDSSLNSVPRLFDLRKMAEGYATVVGDSNVRAYTVAPLT